MGHFIYSELLDCYVCCAAQGHHLFTKFPHTLGVVLATRTLYLTEYWFDRQNAIWIAYSRFVLYGLCTVRVRFYPLLYKVIALT